MVSEIPKQKRFYIAGCSREISAKTGFTEMESRIYWKTCFLCDINTWPKKKKKGPKFPNYTSDRMTGQIKMFHFLPTGWIRAKRCATIVFSQIRCCSKQHPRGLFHFPFFFFPPLNANPTVWVTHRTRELVVTPAMASCSTLWIPVPIRGRRRVSVSRGRIHYCRMLWLTSAELTLGKKKMG